MSAACAAVLLGILLAAAPGARAQEAILTPIGAATALVRAADAEDQATETAGPGTRLVASQAVQLGAGAEAAALELVVVSVARDDEPADPVLTGGAEGRLDTDASPPRVVVTLDSAGLVGSWVGTYAVTIAVMRAGAGKPDETLELALTLPGFEFRAPSALVIGQTCSFGFRCVDSPAVLTLEVTRPALASDGWPSDLRAWQDGTVARGSAPAPGAVRVADFAQLQDAPGVRQAEVSVASRFDIGETTGTLRVTAPQTRPLEVDFTVKKRDGLWMLGVVVFLGLCAGWLVRFRLQGLIDANRRQGLLLRFRRDLAGVRDSVADAKLLTALETLDEEVRKTEVGAEADDALATKLEAWRGTLDAALQELRQRETELAADVAAFEDTLFLATPAPSDAETALSKARAAPGAIRDLLAKRNVGRAKTALVDATRALNATYEKLAGEWETVQRDAITGLAETVPPLPEDLAGEVLAEANAAIEALEDERLKLAGAIGTADLAVAKALQAQINTVGPASRAAISALRRRLTIVAELVRRKLHGHLLAEREAVLENAAREINAHDLSIWSGGAEDVAALRELLARLTGAMTEAVRSVAPTPEDVEPDLAAGRYETAATAAVAARAAMPGDDQGQQAARGRVAADFQSIEPAPPWMRPPVQFPARSGIGAAMGGLPPLVAIDRDIESARERGASASAWQFVALALPLMGASYLLYGESFVGSWQQYVTLFLWGFATDVTASAALERARAVAP